MRPISLHPFLFAAAVLLVSAPPSTASDVLLTAPPRSQGCPVTITVTPQRKSSGQAQLAKAPDNATARGIHVSLQDIGNQAIRSADVVIHARPLKGRVLLAASGPDEEVTKAFHLLGDRILDESISSDLWMRNISSIRSVSIASIEYMAAPAWKASKTQSCVSAINGSMLIGELR